MGTTFLLIALGAAGGTLVIRAILEMFGALFVLASKPFSCDLCMSWWCSIIAATIHFSFVERFNVLFGFYVLASVPVSMVLLKTIERLKPKEN
jgi:hypothetical protein